jgi:hypothetical protein
MDNTNVAIDKSMNININNNNVGIYLEKNRKKNIISVPAYNRDEMKKFMKSISEILSTS